MSDKECCVKTAIAVRAETLAEVREAVEGMVVTTPRPEQGDLETHLEWQRRWKDWRIAQDDTNTTIALILATLFKLEAP